MSMVLASVTSWDRLFQSLMVLGRNEYCWYLAMLLRELLVVSSSLTGKGGGRGAGVVLNSISGNDVVDSVQNSTIVSTVRTIDVLQTWIQLSLPLSLLFYDCRYFMSKSKISEIPDHL